MVRIPPEVIEEITQHGRRAYPAECCGILVGKNGKEKRVIEAYATKNLREGERQERYEIDPLEFFRVDKEAREAGLAGLEVIGFYHSHPDHPPYPSSVDLQMAWPGYMYLILSMVSGNVKSFKVWVLNEGKAQFREEPLFFQS